MIIKVKVYVNHQQVEASVYTGVDDGHDCCFYTCNLAL